MSDDTMNLGGLLDILNGIRGAVPDGENARIVRATVVLDPGVPDGTIIISDRDRYTTVHVGRAEKNFMDTATETIRAHRDGHDGWDERRGVYGDQDDILIALSESRRVTCEMLVKLPPWRAVLIARMLDALERHVVVEAKGVCPRIWPLDDIVAEARRVGGAGRMVPPTAQFTG